MHSTMADWEDHCPFAQGLRMFRQVNGEASCKVTDSDVREALDGAGMLNAPIPVLKALLALTSVDSQRRVLKEHTASEVLQIAGAADFLGAQSLTDVCAAFYATTLLPNELASELRHFDRNN